MKVSNYKELIVWQKSMDLAEGVYKATVDFPKEETYGLTSQMRRSAVSVASNIAEGYSRNSRGEFIQFLGIAKGSLSELETQILLAVRLGFIKEDNSEIILGLCVEVSKILTVFKTKLKAQQN
jgi:four helix bundle protein